MAFTSTLIFVVFMGTVFGASWGASSSCEDQLTCDSCLGSVDCFWCKKLVPPNTQFSRCFHKNQRINCADDEVEKAEKSRNDITRDQEISKTMRIKPQGVELQLAVGQKEVVNLDYKDATDRPLDLYYIMDLSATMKDDKHTVSTQAKKLVSELQKITSDVRLGFGSFIDKPVLPFVSSSQLRGDPGSDGQTFDIPYGFRNWLSLTDDIARFTDTVAKANISSNLDEPEGTLDALMQAITCKREIGWRDASRKLIVVATDGSFHIAGDGKLGGVVRPNDMKCHMQNNLYTHSKILDYPSIGEINNVILQEKVYVIFAVSQNSETNSVFSVYKKLEDHIRESTAELLEADSSNVVQKIKKKYQDISNKVSLTIEDPPSNVKITVLAKCPKQSTYSETTVCSNVAVSDPIKFQIQVELIECPKPGVKPKNQIVVSFFDLSSSEKLVINVTYACVCGCNSPKDRITDASKLNEYCSGKSSTKFISCGSCECQDGFTGENCQCSAKDEIDQGNSTGCIDPSPKGDPNVKCSSSSMNRGECMCGRCVCHPDYNGKYCQHSTGPCRNPKSSNEDRDKLCSDKGNCVEGKCRDCKSGYEGTYCDCETASKASCVEPGKPLHNQCNGNGKCVCGNEQQTKCECNPDYGGLYCEWCKSDDCTTSDEQKGRCQDLKLQECIKCKILNSGDVKSSAGCKCDWPPVLASDQKGKQNTRLDIGSVRISERRTLNDVSGTECTFNINSTCTARFRYIYERDRDQDTLQVYYIPNPNEISCAKEPPILWLIFAVISSVLLAGILGLLVWKLATHIHDSREFQRFEKERAEARWTRDDNPLYNKPTTEFQNPAFQG